VHGVTAVLDLTAEFTEAAMFRGMRYRNVPMLDLTAPTQEQLQEAAAFIVAEAARGVVYVHCKIGYSRSAAAVAAYLIASGKAATAEKAVAHLRDVRPRIIIRPEAMAALERFAVGVEPDAQARATAMPRRSRASSQRPIASDAARGAA